MSVQASLKESGESLEARLQPIQGTEEKGLANAERIARALADRTLKLRVLYHVQIFSNVIAIGISLALLMPGKQPQAFGYAIIVIGVVFLVSLYLDQVLRSGEPETWLREQGLELPLINLEEFIDDQGRFTLTWPEVEAKIAEYERQWAVITGRSITVTLKTVENLEEDASRCMGWEMAVAAENGTLEKSTV